MAYAPLPDPNVVECTICGVLVNDTAAHDAWHAETDGTDPPDPPDPESDFASVNGFYPGAFWAWDPPRRFDTAETQLNRQIPYTTVMLDQGGNEGDPQAMVGSSHFLVADGRIYEYHDRVIPIVSIPLAWRHKAEGITEQDEALQATIDGTYDDNFLAVATMSESDGKRSVTHYSELIARLGWELNGNWPDWSMRDGRHDLFIAAWQHVAPIFIDNGWRMMWCVMESQWAQGFGPEAWPGDEWVDYVNVDHYRREDKRPSIDVLRNIAEFAAEHGKPISFAEWGFGSDTPEGEEGVIVDDGEWIDAVADFYAELGGQLKAQVPFSPPDRDWLDTKTMPNVNGRWRARFGQPAPTA